MNLEQTPESIVPEQSVIDSWPKLHRKKGEHACQGKCPNYTDEQCCHCLIAEVEQPEPEGCEHHPLKCCECMLKEIDEEYLSYLSDEEKHLNAALKAVEYVT